MAPWEQVPALREPASAVHWIEARELSGARVWLPAACCFLALPFPAETGWSVADSNGCAAADTLEAATTAAVLECIEREAVAIWWHHACPRPAIEAAGMITPHLQPLCDWLASRKRRHHLLDLTTDLAVPVVAATSFDADGGNVAFGFGAGLSALSALESALLEMLQDELLLSLTGEGDDRAWRDRVTLAARPHLIPQGNPTPCETLEERSPAADLAGLADALLGAGLHPIVLDLTRPALRIPVVRVVIPGMRHYRMSLAPGRLYEVPQRLGWKTSTFDEIAAAALPFVA